MTERNLSDEAIAQRYADAVAPQMRDYLRADNKRLEEINAELLEIAKLFRDELALCNAMAGPLAEKVGALEDRVNAAIRMAETA